MRIVLPLLAVALVAGGCGERAEPTGSAVRLYPVTVEGAGDRPVSLSSAPRRIAAVARGPRATLIALGAGSRLTERDRTVDRNGRILVHLLAVAPPDLVVASPETDAVDLSRLRRAVRAPIYVAPDSSLDDIERSIADLGLLTDRTLDSRRLVSAIEAKRRDVRRRVAGKPATTVFVDTGFFITVSDHSLVGDLVREAGGRNTGGPSPEAGPFDLARLAQIDPDVIVATSDSGVTLADLRARARTRRLKAVRDGRFGIVPTRLLEPGPRVGEGLEALARLLHPDAFR